MKYYLLLDGVSNLVASNCLPRTGDFVKLPSKLPSGAGVSGEYAVDKVFHQVNVSRDSPGGIETITSTPYVLLRRAEKK